MPPQHAMVRQDAGVRHAREAKREEAGDEHRHRGLLAILAEGAMTHVEGSEHGLEAQVDRDHHEVEHVQARPKEVLAHRHDQGEELDLATDEIALKLDPEQVAVPRGGLPPRARCLGWTSSACSLRMPLRGNDPLLT